MKPVKFTPTAKSLAGSKTFDNLMASYMVESAAYSRYTFYADQAKKESYFQISNVFAETAANELHHAKIYFKYLVDFGDYNIPLGVTAGVIGNTSDNLGEAAREEELEGVDSYKKYAEIAREEGYPEVADHFDAIAEVEKSHRERFLEYKKQVDEGTVWKRDKPIKWQCLVCGYIFEGTEPPQKCPACDHPYQHYRALDMEL